MAGISPQTDNQGDLEYIILTSSDQSHYADYMRRDRIPITSELLTWFDLGEEHTETDDIDNIDDYMEPDNDLSDTDWKEVLLTIIDTNDSSMHPDALH